MTNWQRLEQVISWTGLSTNAFAKAIGLKRSENLYQIKRGSFGISKELARLIVAKYPVVCRSWLLTGDDQMLRAEQGEITASTIGNIPFYDMDVLQLLSNGDLENRKPLYSLVLPSLSGADFAAVFAGNSMYPEIANGMTVVFKAMTMESILMGEAYLIITSDFSTIRYVRSIAGNKEQISLVPANTKDYDEMVIDRTKVEKIFMVRGVISYK